ncbi:nucleotidyltransferase domain-containing protein [Microvirga sp. GCM10011540]|uniref:nucleotidyltransferase domain-containing protein n=1 Tax=Microvirga sp. GCM10011540 TaxID=3317338 RepID=UPI00360FBDEA
MSIEIPHAVRTAAARLAEATGAEAVVLFGSRARGDHDGASDWDLCVILPDDVEPGRFTPLTLWPLVSDLGIPIQVVPIRKSVFEAQRGNVNSVSHDIARDCIVIWSRPGDPISRIQALADAYPDAEAELAGGLRHALRVEDLSEDDLARIRAARVETGEPYNLDDIPGDGGTNR